GQGTANVCFCFDNAFLELLYVVDEVELASALVARTGLTGRAKGRGSPVGLAFRGEAFGGPDLETWPYRLSNFPPGLSLEMAACNADLAGPLCFGVGASQGPALWTGDRRVPLQREAGFVGLQLAAISTPQPFAPAIQARVEKLGATLRHGQHAVDLAFVREDGTKLPWSYVETP